MRAIGFVVTITGTIVLVFVVSVILVGCGQDLRCDGPEEDCSCEVYMDCELTPYSTEVVSETDCYDIECACDVALNDEAAQRNEQSWTDMDCNEVVEQTECNECSPGYKDQPACVDNICVKPMARGTEDNQPRPGEYI